MLRGRARHHIRHLLVGEAGNGQHVAVERAGLAGEARRICPCPVHKAAILPESRGVGGVNSAARGGAPQVLLSGASAAAGVERHT